MAEKIKRLRGEGSEEDKDGRMKLKWLKGIKMIE